MILLNACITEEIGGINETVILNNSSRPISFVAYGARDTTTMLVGDGEQAKEVRRGDTGSAEVSPIESDSIMIT